MKKILLGGAFCLFLFLAHSGDAYGSFFNWGSCLRWRISGICKIVCVKGHCHIWIRIKHWRPDEVSETVNKPGDSIWGKSYPGVMASIFGASGQGGGGVRTASGALTNEKFFESHVIGVPWGVMVKEQPFLSKLGCKGGGGGLKYASEPDPFWHNDDRDQGQDAESSMVGLWGPLYPRQGRAFHGSDVVASALLSYRAVDIASGAGGKQIQLGYPTKTGCMDPGLDPREWDYDRGKKGTGGKYLWVYQKPVSCCKHVH